MFVKGMTMAVRAKWVLRGLSATTAAVAVLGTWNYTVHGPAQAGEVGRTAVAATGDAVWQSQHPTGREFQIRVADEGEPVTAVLKGDVAFVGDVAVGQRRGDQVVSHGGVVMLQLAADDEVRPLGTGIIDVAGLKWTSATVPYVFDAGSTSGARAAFEAAARDYAANTPVRFVPRTNQRNYVRLINDSGCYSYVGMTSLSSRAEGQPLSLGSGCENVNVARHEMGHAVGLQHEQVRIDRDQYIKVNYDLLEGSTSQYDIDHSANNRPIGTYDFESMMHYRNYRVGNRWIFESKTGFPNEHIGNDRVNGFTAGDKAAIAAIYGGGGQGVSLAVGQAVSLQVATDGFTNRYLRHRDSIVRTDVVTASSDLTLKADATFTIRAGLDGTPCYSFESVNFPGRYLRHSGFQLRIDPSANASPFREDATFCAQSGLRGTGVSLVSRNFPDRYVRHRYEQVVLDQSDGSLGFRQDASWVLAAPWR